MITDALGDMLTRVRNAVRAKHEMVEIPFSRMNEAVAKILQEEGFVGAVRTGDRQARKHLLIPLKYADKKSAVLREIRRVSRPSRRVYVGYKDIRTHLGGYGVTILTTPKGVMTGAKARREKLGGEWICTLS